MFWEWIIATNCTAYFSLHKIILFIFYSELEEAILMLPYNRVLELLVAIKGIVDRDWDVELASRVLIVAIRVNFSQLVLNKSAFPIIKSLANSLPTKLDRFQVNFRL